jgi:hypothetical protein
MLNISHFLSQGQTSLYTRKAAVVANTAAALIIPLAISALTGCSSASATPSVEGSYQKHDSIAISAVNAFAQVSPSSRGPVADLHVTPDGRATAYAVDGNTLLLQAMLDPSMTKLSVVSSTSAFLDQFLDAQSQSVRAKRLTSVNPETWGDVPAQTLAEAVYRAGPNGFSFNTEDGDRNTCAVMSVGTSRHKMPNGKVSGYVDFSSALYVASGAANDALVTLHEISHCHPITDITVTDQPLSAFYKTSVYEARSDLAVVLYVASKTGSFHDGLAAIGGMRSELQQDFSHTTMGMLNYIVSGLTPSDFVGKPVDAIIRDAVKIVDSLKPDTNQRMKLEFAKEAWGFAAVGHRGGRLAPAGSGFAEFAGQAFTVDLDKFSSDILDHALDNAILNADVVRASRSMPVSRVEDFARMYNYQPTRQQMEKAEFVDGNITPVGTLQSADGSLVVKQNPLSISTLQADVVPALRAMLASGVVTRPRQNPEADIAQIVNGSESLASSPSMVERFGSALTAVGRSLKQQERDVPKPRGPSL